MSDATEGARPMGRRERKKAQTRDKIFEAAMALFAKAGYDSVTIEQICDEADVANGTFFLHFPTKAAVLDELNVRLSDSLLAELKGQEGSAAEKLRQVREAVIKLWSDHAALMQHLLREVMTRPLEEQAQGATQDLIVLVREIVAEGQASGEFSKEFAPDVAASLLIAGWNGITVVFAGQNDDDGALAANQHVLDFILRALEPR